MPKQVVSPVSHQPQIALAVTAALQLILAFVSTLWLVIHHILWLSVLFLAAIWAGLFVWLRKRRVARYILRGAGIVLAAFVAATVGLTVYAMMTDGIFAENPAGWLQMILCYVYTVLICVLPASVTAAWWQEPFEVWSLRVQSILTFLLTAYLTFYEHPYVATLLHAEPVNLWLGLLCAVSLAQIVMSFRLKPIELPRTPAKKPSERRAKADSDEDEAKKHLL